MSLHFNKFEDLPQYEKIQLPKNREFPMNHVLEVINDTIQVLGNNFDATKPFYLIQGLFTGLPPHDNFFHIIKNNYNMSVPDWYRKKYETLDQYHQKYFDFCDYSDKKTMEDEEYYQCLAELEVPTWYPKQYPYRDLQH